ncbi:hypothetical protein VTH82DRAFT_5480 [Thermothelomyces myriococcoides]
MVSRGSGVGIRLSLIEGKIKKIIPIAADYKRSPSKRPPPAPPVGATTHPDRARAFAHKPSELHFTWNRAVLVLGSSARTGNRWRFL